MKIQPEILGNTEGFRIVNMECLGTFVSQMTKHVILCGKITSQMEPVKLLGEVGHHGLASFIAVMCNGCGKTITLDSPKMPGDLKYEINVRAVWGQMVTGGGGSPLQEQCATMGMPSMTGSAFSSIEEQIGCWWKQVQQTIACTSGHLCIL